MGHGLQIKMTSDFIVAIRARASAHPSDASRHAELLCDWAEKTHQELVDTFKGLFPELKSSELTFETISFLTSGPIPQTCTDKQSVHQRLFDRIS